MADDARISSAFGRKDSVIGAWVDVIGFEVEVVEG